ncbi:tigger transposable element-derived protein 4-like [Belonocnema kinseyi]|uniref:tigger transposable element-derived protein 4-like n=1 Tax=Belonocnema kinseyi TaxID=2817044 RepID=UPI00143DA116|nr:tigger transposable element-derived protein 4-like [Belonocnema kinseyi]
MFSRNPLLSLREGAAKLKKKGHDISHETIRTYLHANDVKCRPTMKKPLLGEKHIEKRLTWAQENVDRDWDEVIFTDEASVWDFKIPANSLTSIVKNKEKILIVIEKAEFFAVHLGYKDFKATSGWIEKFKNRNGIIYRTLNCESASVSKEDCEKFLTDILPSLLEVYAIEDIFNADETGLFFKCLPDKTLTFKGDTCHGGKKTKDRITVMVCANMSGKEKLELLVIGKSKNPRCFKGAKSLPVLYGSNKKAWMTSSV